jgi:hypothetical protein
MREAAAVARAEPAPAIPGPGEFLYTRSIDAYLATSVYRPVRVRSSPPSGPSQISRM